MRAKAKMIVNFRGEVFNKFIFVSTGSIEGVQYNS